MAHRKSAEYLQEELLKSLAAMTSMLKAIDHPNRFRILVLLLEESQTFQMLLCKMKLKKSALANDLKILEEKLLVRKIRHGTYEITADGTSLIQAIGAVYAQSEARRRKLTESDMRYESAKSFLERKTETRENDKGRSA